MMMFDFHLFKCNFYFTVPRTCSLLLGKFYKVDIININKSILLYAANVSISAILYSFYPGPDGERA
jgi:hypothetical protein